jgi:hypothetical protein
MKREAAYIGTLRENKYASRPHFWQDAKDYAAAYLGGGGAWQGAPTGAFGRSVSTGSPEQDAVRRAELLAEIDWAHSQVR